MRRMAQQLRSRSKPKFVLNVFPVSLDGLDTEIQAIGNLAAPQSRSQHMKHLELAVR